MATLSNSEILRIAQAAVPAHIRPLGRVVSSPPATLKIAALKPAAGKARDTDSLIADLAKHVGARPPRASEETAEVEFPEQTALGLRTTIVHVRQGKVERVFKRG